MRFVSSYLTYKAASDPYDEPRRGLPARSCPYGKPLT
jgi:hypothetical protein